MFHIAKHTDTHTHTKKKNTRAEVKSVRALKRLMLEPHTETHP